MVIVYLLNIRICRVPYSTEHIKVFQIMTTYIKKIFIQKLFGKRIASHYLSLVNVLKIFLTLLWQRVPVSPLLYLIPLLKFWSFPSKSPSHISQKGFSHTTNTILKPTLLNRDSKQGRKET